MIRCDAGSDVATGKTSAKWQSSGMLRRLFRLNSTPTSTLRRLCGQGVTGTGNRKGWGVSVHNGGTVGLVLQWFEAAVNNGGAAAASLSNNVIYDLLIVFDNSKPGGGAGIPAANAKVRVFLNGTEVVDGSGDGLGVAVTGIPDIANSAADGSGTPAAYTWGKDSASATNNAALADHGEEEWSSDVPSDPAALASALYNSGVFKRLREFGYTITNYYPAVGNETTTLTDCAGGDDLTCTSITVPVSTYCDHPAMYEPLAEFIRADLYCYDATSGGSLVANNGAASRWEDISGRKLHLTVASAGQEPHLRNGSTDLFPSLFFDKFNSSWDPQATGLQIADVRLNPGAFTVAGVYSARGWRGDLNGTSANNPGGFNTIWSVDGNTSPSTRLVLGIDAGGADYSSGIVRIPNATNTGTSPIKGSDGTPSGQLFAPTSPSLLIQSSDGTDIYVGINDLSTANSATKTQAFAAANTTGGIVVGRNPGNVNFNFDGAIYALKFYNRAITSGERTAIRDAYEAQGLITVNPTEIWFGMGSSSMWGQQAAYGRELFHYLWNTKAQARRAWIYNYGSPRSRLDVDSVYTTTSVNTVPKHDTHAVDTIDIVQGLFPTLPVRLVTWAGINDLSGALGAPTAAQTAVDTMTRLNTYLDNRITAIGASRIRQSVVITPWINSDMAGAELTERTAFNAALFTDAGYGVKWRKVIDLRSTVLDDMTTAGATYTSDSKHPNETAFASIIGPAVASKMLHTSGARRCRARSLFRKTSALDYAQR